MAADCGSTCPVDGGFYSYDPSVAGNAVLLAAFCLTLPVVLFTGFRFRTPVFSAVLTTGVLLEILGFVGRVLIKDNRDHQVFFVLSLLGTLLGPAFASLAVFLVLPHTLIVYGESLSPVRPVVAGFILYSLIVLAIVLQVVGLVFAAYGSSNITSMESAGIVAGGLGLQTITLLLFTALHIYIILGVSARRNDIDPKHAVVYHASAFKRFLRAMEAATVLLIAYSIYRIVEMAGGVDGALFQNEVGFMVVCGAVPLLSCALLGAFSPGAAFGPAWISTSPRRPKRHHVPPPIQSQAAAPWDLHHRYDPNIPKSVSPTAYKHPKHGSQSQKGGSPGLPPNPRPTSKPPSPMMPRPPSTTSPRVSPGVSPSSVGDRSISERLIIPERPERGSRAPKPALVEPDALW